MSNSNWQDAKNSLSTIRDWIRFGASCFAGAELFYGHGTDNSWDEALSLVLSVVQLSEKLGDKLFEAKLTSNEKDAIIALFERRIVQRIPAPYLTHKAHYAGFEFYVDERVLIPRSPIAELIEKQLLPWVKPEKVMSMLDLGTGSACLPILLAYYFPHAQIDAVDNDPNALQVAKINVENYDASHQIQLIQSDLFTALTGKTYDVIISNPPYVDAEDMQALPAEFLHEPRHALASGDDGLNHVKIILQQAKCHLNPKGILIVEVGNSSLALEQAFPEYDFTWLEFRRGGTGVFVLSYDQLRD